MAEFCKDCASKLGMEPDSRPLLCEGCGKYFGKRNTLVWWIIALIVLAVIVVQIMK